MPGPTIWTFAETCVHDLRHACRLLRRTPALAAFVVLTLALGIGLCASVVAVLDAELLRPKVDKDPKAFFRVIPAFTFERTRQSEPGLVPLADYDAYRAGASELADIAGFDRIPTIVDRDEAAVVNSLLVTCNFFAVYGLEQPKMGRLLRDDDCSTAGAQPVVVLSEEIWRARFGEAPDIVGTTVLLNQRALTVVGVAPARFSGRNYRDTHAWIPYTMQPGLGPNSRLRGGGPADRFREPNTPWLQVEGRLRSGISRDHVHATLRVVAAQQDRLHRDRQTTLAVTDGSALANPFRRSDAMWPLILVVGSMTLILMVVSTNAAMLLLAKAAARRREIAVRLSIGASRRRLLRMLLTESLILAAAAGAISLWIAWVLPPVLRDLLTTEPANYQVRPDWVAFAYLAAATLLAGTVAGLTPALESLRLQLTGMLETRERIASTASAGSSRVRHVLVTIETALSVVLLVVAASIVRANGVLRAQAGFETQQVLSAPLTSKPDDASSAAKEAFYRALTNRLEEMPAIASIAYANQVRQSDIEGFRAPEGGRAEATARAVTVGYFTTLAIPLLEGREFTELDAAAPEPAPVIVSDSLARTLWPGLSAPGRELVDSAGKRFQVIGVARGLPRSVFNATERQVYVALPLAGPRELVVRFSGDAASTARAIAALARDLEPNTLMRLETLQLRAERSDPEMAVLARLVTALGAMTASLVLVGVYGLMAYVVKQRTRELGIRSALGAQRRELARTVYADGIKPVGVGLAGGLLVAIAGGFVMRQAFRNTPIPIAMDDPMPYVAACVVLSLAVSAALFLPARRAAAVEPSTALRHE